MLLKKGYQVLLFDTPGRAGLEGGHPGLVPVFADPEVKTWHQTAALLATCDGFLGPDSGVTHLAGALGAPGVALFGPFSSRLRVDCYPSLKGMDGQAPCAPCFHHTGATGIQWPAGGPCVKTGKCVALQELVPVRVVHQLERWMEERRGARAA
jgi:ADP-heptose:LPS heptosyltransferase